MSELPPGFVLDNPGPPAAASAGPPAGFVLDQPSMIVDAAKSLPSGMLGGLSSALSSGGQAAAIEMGQPDLQAQIPGADQTKQIIEQNVTGEMHKPQTAAGRIAYGAGEALGNPASYVGPGGLALKVGGAALSGAGGEAGAEIGGTPGRFIGSLAGGAAAARMLGPKAAVAAIPTQAELRASADAGYDAARNSGLALNSAGPAKVASAIEQELTNGPKYAFTGGPNGTAPKTFATLAEAGNPPAGAVVTAANLDTLRRRLGDIAGETAMGPAGPRPTSDAKAAMVALRRFDNYRENIPESHVVAGDPQAYRDAIKQANGDYAAASRVGLVAKKVDDATTNYEGSIAASLGNQIKSQIRPILKNPKAQRGFTGDEISALNGVNKGTIASNTLSQIGRGGAGVIPMLTQAAVAVPAAFATGGASVLPQAALALGLYGARKAGERLTLAQAQNVMETLAKRSPLYQQRAGQLPPPPSNAPQMAQILRSLLLAR